MASALSQGSTNAAPDLIEDLLPSDALPKALAPLTDPLEWVEDAFRIVPLVEGGRPLCAVPTAGTRVMGVPFKFSYFI